MPSFLLLEVPPQGIRWQKWSPSCMDARIIQAGNKCWTDVVNTYTRTAEPQLWVRPRFHVWLFDLAYHLAMYSLTILYVLNLGPMVAMPALDISSHRLCPL